MPQPTALALAAALALGAPAAEQRNLPLQTRAVPVATVDADARTFETVWTTGARVRRYDWWTGTYYLEELSLDPAHVRLDRMNGGAPLLNSHQQWDLSSVLGVTEKAWMEATEGRSV
ncbi:MAG: peptidase S14, partial [Oxalobacteraceae bacterium]